MATYRSAMGKNVDMAALAAANERVRAVGNGRMNARGDTIDSSGRVIKPNTSKVNEHYAGTVTNRGAVAARPRPPTAARPPQPPITEEDLSMTDHERELENAAQDDALVERIKAAEIKAAESKRSKSK